MEVGYTDQCKLTYVMKVYDSTGLMQLALQGVGTSTFQKKVLANTSTSPISVINPPVTIQVIRAKIIL